FKLVETPNSQIYRGLKTGAPPLRQPSGPGGGGQTAIADIDVRCNNCGHTTKVQANLGQAHPLKPGSVPFPPNNRLKCSNCSMEHDLSPHRRDIEAQTGLPLITDPGNP